MNPDTNKFEKVMTEAEAEQARKDFERLKSHVREMATGEVPMMLHESVAIVPPGLLRPDGSPVPKHWSVFIVGELVAIKNYTFRVAYIGESAILFEPVGPVVVGEVPK